MRKIAIAFFLAALLAANCAAASIEAAESVPAGTPWSFSVALPNAPDFETAQVFLDGDRIAKVSGGSGIDVLPSSVDKTKVFSYTEAVDSRIYFLISPLGNGEHGLLLRIDGSEADEQQVEFFEIYDAESEADLQSQVSSLRGSVNSLVDQFNALEEKLGEKLGEADLEGIRESISSLEEEVSALQTALEEEKAGNSRKMESILSDLSSLNARTADLNSSLGVGFAALSLKGLGPEAQLALVLIAGVVIVIVLAARFKDRIRLSRGLYGRPGKENVVFSSRDEEITEQVLSESQDEEKKGKWAFGPGEKRGKRFSIGDLIRK